MLQTHDLIYILYHCTRNILQTNKQMSLMRSIYENLSSIRKIDIIADSEASHCKFSRDANFKKFIVDKQLEPHVFHNFLVLKISDKIVCHA